MPLLPDNPFTSLTLIAAPAVLTNASSVLALGTSNRFARAIDRARALSAILEKETVSGDPLTLMRVRHLNRAERRFLLLLHPLRFFYLALGSFVAALTSLLPPPPTIVLSALSGLAALLPGAACWLSKRGWLCRVFLRKHGLCGSGSKIT